jgi:hypothetical protein
MPSGITLAAGVVVGSPIALDGKYGPYNSTTDALNDLGPEYRYKGLTVGILSGSSVVEYWFKDGTDNTNFVLKNSASDWETLANKPSTFPPSTHSHAITDVTDLSTTLAAKADLISGKVPTTQLPSYVDDVIEVLSQGNLLLLTGETGKIYVTLDDNKCWRWTGTTYIEISPSSGQISAIVGLQEALNGRQTTIFKQATMAVTTATTAYPTFLVASFYSASNGADLRRTLTTITFASNMTFGSVTVRLPEWLTTGLGAWRGDQAFFKYAAPTGFTINFQYYNGSTWSTLLSVPGRGTNVTEYAAFQATIETGTYVEWMPFETLYGLNRQLASFPLTENAVQEYNVNSVLLPNGDVGSGVQLTRNTSVPTPPDGSENTFNAEQLIYRRVNGTAQRLDTYLGVKLEWQPVAPTQPTSPGSTGQIAYNDPYFYICVGVNKWRRIPVAAW